MTFPTFGKLMGIFTDFKEWVKEQLQVKSIVKYTKHTSEQTNNMLDLIHDTLFDEKNPYASRMTKQESDEVLTEHIAANVNHSIEAIKCKDNIKPTETIQDAKGKKLSTYIWYLQKLEAETEGLGILIRQRQWLEAIKVPTILEKTLEHLKKGKSVAIFVNYKETLNFIKDNIKNVGISLIYGKQAEKDRKEQIEMFQNNKNRIIICILQAGGVGISLHDTNGNFPRVSIICPTWSGQDMRQCFGRIDRQGTMSGIEQYILYVVNTYEEYICGLMLFKLKTLSGINTGDITEKTMYNID
jgi:superfamily II DNA or RNA helicase